jgi:ribonuclease III
MHATMANPKRPPRKIAHPPTVPTETVQPVDDRPERLAAALGLTFADIELLRTALTHRSVLHDWTSAAPGLTPPQSNERLEFLGDAYLGVIVAEYLYNHDEDAPEGVLTSRRVSLVRAERLVSWAREINLGDYLYLGQGERVTEGVRDRMLAGAFEALIAAITLDQGLNAARTFLNRFLDRDMRSLPGEEELANPKGRLQEILQDRYRVGPVYRTIKIEGPDHSRTFTAEVLLNGRSLGTGQGGSKRDAEQAAAQVALEVIVQGDNPPVQEQIATTPGPSTRPPSRRRRGSAETDQIDARTREE